MIGALRIVSRAPGSPTRTGHVPTFRQRPAASFNGSGGSSSELNSPPRRDEETEGARRGPSRRHRGPGIRSGSTTGPPRPDPRRRIAGRACRTSSGGGFCPRTVGRDTADSPRRGASARAWLPHRASYVAAPRPQTVEEAGDLVPDVWPASEPTPVPVDQADEAIAFAS